MNIHIQHILRYTCEGTPCSSGPEVFNVEQERMSLYCEEYHKKEKII